MSTKAPPKGARTVRRGHGLDRGDGRDARGRFVKGGAAPVDCFWKAISAVQRRHLEAVNSIGEHISATFMWWVNHRK